MGGKIDQTSIKNRSPGQHVHFGGFGKQERKLFMKLRCFLDVLGSKQMQNRYMFMWIFSGFGKQKNNVRNIATAGFSYFGK